jgi:hypothetical protein
MISTPPLHIMPEFIHFTLNTLTFTLIGAFTIRLTDTTTYGMPACNFTPPLGLFPLQRRRALIFKVRDSAAVQAAPYRFDVLIS